MTLSIVIITVVTCNLAILYFPIDKKMRVTLCAVTSGILVLCCLCDNGQRGAIPLDIKEHIAKNPYAKQPLMARFNISEEQLNNDMTRRTPIESGVNLVLVIALVLTPVLLNIAVNKKNNNEEKMKVLEGVAFTLNIVAVWLLLSLNFGFELPSLMVPWIKNMPKKDETSSGHNEETHLAVIAK